MNAFLEIESKGKNIRIRSKLFENVKKIKPVLNEKAWNIFKEISKKESYSSEISKKLKMSNQETHYYINKLKKAGLIELSKTEEKKGALAKYYSAKHSSISIVPSIEELQEQRKEIFEGKEKEVENNIQKFIEPFIFNERLDVKIIVGSPDAHGEQKARARDAHLGIELACALGSMAKEVKYPLVFLDTMVSKLEKENSNLVVIGGPITNRISSELNEFLPLFFEAEEGQWVIKSKPSGKSYTEDSIGVIEKIVHPFFPKKNILFIAGKRNAGTKSAILAFLKELDEIVKGNFFDKSVKAKIVEGLDLDSDGQIDEIEIRE